MFWKVGKNMYRRNLTLVVAAIVVLIAAGLIYWQRARIFGQADVINTANNDAMPQLDKTTYKPGENIVFNFINKTGSKIPFLYVVIFPSNLVTGTESSITTAWLTANWKSQMWSAQIVNSYADGTGGLANGDHWGKTWDQKNTFTKTAVPEDSYTAVYVMTKTAGLSQIYGVALKPFSISSSSSTDAYGIDFSTDKTSYNQGESVVMSATNKSQQPMAIGTLTITAKGGANIVFNYSFNTLLAANQTKSYTWKQIGGSLGLQVESGDYLVTGSYATADKKIHSTTKEFTILTASGGTPNSPTTLPDFQVTSLTPSTVKAGTVTPVMVEIKNTGGNDIPKDKTMSVLVSQGNSICFLATSPNGTASYVYNTLTIPSSSLPLGGQSATYLASYVQCGRSGGTIIVKANNDNAIPETNYNNNQATFPIAVN